MLFFVYIFAFKGPFGGEQKIRSGWKNGRIEEILVSLIAFGWGGGVKKWTERKLFCLVEKRNKRIKNVDCINLQCSYDPNTKKKLYIRKKKP